MVEHEITQRVALTTPSGDLNPDALGWTRTPLHDTSMIGAGHRRRDKRWEYWAVMSPKVVLAATVSDLDLLAVHSVWALDRDTDQEAGHTVVVPGGAGVTLPPSSGEGPTRVRTRSLVISLDEQDHARGTRLRGWTPRVSFDLVAELPEGHERLGVVIPWRKGGRIPSFQYTLKDVARPVRGWIAIDGVRHRIDEGAWAVLDHGRGRWPHRVRWNWAAGSGFVDGHVVGLQLGSKWTDGSGATENALVVDGHLTKISEELVWDYDQRDWMRPWHISGDCADLSLTPFHHRHSRAEALVVAQRADQVFGRWSGWVRDDRGADIRVEGVEGWAEDVANRW